ncbi:MAG: chalcone isomerase family protein [Betaproteobacteria bacterium]|nr:chalcone isomerase family protein [Betaproteobacteria bacterium]
MSNIRFILLATALSACLLCASPAGAQSLPEPVVREQMGLTPRGEAAMRFWGLKVYDIRLWTAMKPYSPDETFALELVYDMSLKGRDIAERSVDLMREQGVRDEAKLARWLADMARIFPDVKKGDALIGVFVPGKEVRFYSRDKLISAVPDAEFARAFFDIWLSEKTSEPRLRQRLLGAQ